MSHRQWRLEEEGRRNSLEEENIDIDGLHRLKVFDKIKELVGELQELHKTRCRGTYDSCSGAQGHIFSINSQGTLMQHDKWNEHC